MVLRSEADVPSVESLMASHLSRFIQFAAHDCGWPGTRFESIVNWVHSLFLKAKTETSKENNPNWCTAMNRLFRWEYWNVAYKEIWTFESMNAWEVVDCTGKWMSLTLSGHLNWNVYQRDWWRNPKRKSTTWRNTFFWHLCIPVVQWATVRIKEVPQNTHTDKYEGYNCITLCYWYT